MIHHHRRSPMQPNRSRRKAKVKVRAKAKVMGPHSKETTPGSNRLCNPTHEEAAHWIASLHRNPNRCWYQSNKPEMRQSRTPRFAEGIHCNPTGTTALRSTCLLHQCISTHQHQNESAHYQKPSAAIPVHCNPTATKDSHCSRRHLADPDRDSLLLDGVIVLYQLLGPGGGGDGPAHVGGDDPNLIPCGALTTTLVTAN